MAFTDWKVVFNLEKSGDGGGYVALLAYTNGRASVHDRVPLLESATDETVAEIARVRILGLEAAGQIPDNLTTGELAISPPEVAVRLEVRAEIPVPSGPSPLEAFQVSWSRLQTWNRLVQDGVVPSDAASVKAAREEAQKLFSEAFVGSGI